MSWKDSFLGAGSCLQAWHVFLHPCIFPSSISLHCACHLADMSSSFQSGQASRVTSVDVFEIPGIEAIWTWGSCSLGWMQLCADMLQGLTMSYLAFLYIFFTFSMHCACHLADVIEVYGIILQRFWKYENAPSFFVRYPCRRAHYIFLHLHMPYVSFHG